MRPPAHPRRRPPPRPWCPAHSCRRTPPRRPRTPSAPQAPPPADPPSPGPGRSRCRPAAARSLQSSELPRHPLASPQPPRTWAPRLARGREADLPPPRRDRQDPPQQAPRRVPRPPAPRVARQAARQAPSAAERPALGHPAVPWPTEAPRCSRCCGCGRPPGAPGVSTRLLPASGPSGEPPGRPAPPPPPELASQLRGPAPRESPARLRAGIPRRGPRPAADPGAANTRAASRSGGAGARG
mmetsp:Transcript_73279/g.226314  ORF Transcript_73279/g.226314 Transcript_73279/m.226314 type:complete len:241 (-) Transcript_73279:192-914(-)